MTACHVPWWCCMNLPVDRQFSARGFSPQGAWREEVLKIQPKKEYVCGGEVWRIHAWRPCVNVSPWKEGVEASPYHQYKVVTSVCCLTTLEPCFVQARVRGGFPVHAQVKAASIPVSTVIGLGSDSNLGPTRLKQQPVAINKLLN